MKNYLKQYYLHLIILLFALVGTTVSFILMVEKIHLLKEPDAVLSCSVNSVINCASVMKSPIAEMFGFPNPIIGLIFYPGIATIALVFLTRGIIKRKLLLLVFLTSFISIIFSYRLLFESVYSIKSLCPYCLISCFSATIIFFALTALLFKEKVNKKIAKFYLPIITFWFVIITIVIIIQLNLFNQPI